MHFCKFLIFICTALMLEGCADKTIYEVKKFKYYSDNEVHMEIRTKTGQIQKIICAFPPNTDYELLNKVQIEKVKSDYLIEGTQYDCLALP